MITHRSKPNNVVLVRAAADRGMTRREMAKALGLHYDTIKTIIRQHCIPVVNEKPGPISGREPGAQRRIASRPGTLRRCLCGCGRMFPSEHPGERIAPRCRASWSARV